MSAKVIFEYKDFESLIDWSDDIYFEFTYGNNVLPEKEHLDGMLRITIEYIPDEKENK